VHLEQLVDWVRVILVHINLFHHRELDAKLVDKRANCCRTSTLLTANHSELITWEPEDLEPSTLHARIEVHHRLIMRCGLASGGSHVGDQHHFIAQLLERE